MHRAVRGCGFGTEMKPRLAWSSPLVRKLSASFVAICTQVGHTSAVYVETCTLNLISANPLDTKGYADSFTWKVCRLC